MINRRKSTFIIISLLILILGGLVSLNVYVNKRYPQGETKQTTRTTEEQVPIKPRATKIKENSQNNTVDIDVSGWKVYKDKTLGISFRYPPFWGDISVYTYPEAYPSLETVIFSFQEGIKSYVSIVPLSKQEIITYPARLEEVLREGCEPGPGPCLEDILIFYHLEIKMLEDYPIGTDCTEELNDAAYYGGYLSCKVMQRSDGIKYLLNYHGRPTEKVFTFSSESFLWEISFNIDEFLWVSNLEYGGNIINDIQNGTAPSSLLDAIKPFDTMIETIQFY